MNEKVLSQPWMSWSTLGHAFWRSTRIPSRTGSVHERTFGIPSTCIRQLGHRPGHAEQAARPVVLERAPGDRDARGRQRRTDRVALERRRPCARRTRTRPAGRAGWPRRGAAGAVRSRGRGLVEGSPPPDGSPSPSPGQNVRRTSFVPVCRSARNHVRHPSRCSHHSVCQPLTFSRKNRYPARSRSDASGSGAARAFAAVGELERLPRPAVRTVDEEGHGRASASLGTQTRQVTRSRTASSAFR